MLIYLLRHTAVDVPHGVCYGRTDVPLAPDSAAQIAATLERLPLTARRATRVWSSPAGRCLELARALCAEPALDDRLAEFDFGVWEGRSWDDVPRAELDCWSADLAGYTVPGGESMADLSARARAFMQECVTPEPGLTHAPGDDPSDVVLVTHGGVIRALLADALGMPAERIFRLQVDYGSVSALAQDGTGLRVAFVNR